MQIARSGFLGVVIFFVLSGFIMAYVYQDWFQHMDLASYGRFLGLRLARVYPLHLLTLLIVAVLIWVHVMPLGPNDNIESFSLNLLLLQSWGFTNGISWNAASWSISTELFCYLFFPFVIWLLHRTQWKFCAILTLTAAWWGSLYFYRTTLASVVDISHVQFSYAVSLLSLAFTFLIGVCAFYFTRHLRATGTVVMNGIAIAAFGALIYAAIADSEGYLPQIAAALLIAGLSEDSGIVGMALANRVGQFLGDISYALYLIHSPLVYLWSAVLMKTTNGILFKMVPLPMRIGAVILAATALHYAFERPTRILIRKCLQPKLKAMARSDQFAS